MAFHHCRVVLVETLYPGNLGATARAMHNFGLEELVLVNPAASKTDRRARRLATHGEAILDRARTVADLGAAVADCVLVAGTAARAGGKFRKQNVGPPDAVMPRLVEALKADRPVALVFGTEPKGLPDELVTRCHHLVRVPTIHSSLNLAQAVAICLYELSRSWREANTSADAGMAMAAGFEAQEHMFVRLREALEKIHFVYGAKGDALMHAVRHMLGKACLSPMEVKLLLGLARQISWYADERR